LKMNMDALCKLAVRAGGAIMEVYGTDFEVEYKPDDSPLTRADKLSHSIISEGLVRLYPDVPVISEEGKGVPFDTRRDWRVFWLVDPLDGTKEFVKRRPDFTVNIALVEDGRLTAAVIYAPARDTLYWASDEAGAWKSEKGARPVRINTRRPAPGEGSTVAQSRSHPSEKLAEFLKSVNVKSSISMGSSLKFCMVAEGAADLYPRMGPTWEWDTAAGQCIVEHAGGSVTALDGGPLRYNKPDLLNGGFIVRA
jgi:3'(2'), 5'-bisphosphate nucleotidase